MKKIYAVLLIANLCQPSFGGIILDAAKAMQPGEWRELTTIVPASIGGNLGAMLDACAGGHSITEYADKAVWDPYAKQFAFVGQGHYSCLKYTRYDEASNMWTAHQPAWADCWNAPNPCISHAYEHNEIDPSGIHYYRRHNSGIFTYNKTNNIWSPLAVPEGVIAQVAGALTYFPALNGLVSLDSQNGLWLYDLTSKAWRKLSDNPPMAAYSNFATYNPIHEVMWFGGGSSGSTPNGSRKIYKMDKAGVITPLTDAPFGLGTSNGLTMTITVDPNTGKFLVFRSKDASTSEYPLGLYEYDITKDEWSLVSSDLTKVKLYNTRFWAVATPIYEYGIVMFMTSDFGNSKIFLYKHSPGNGQPLPPPTVNPPPATPKNLKVK